MPRSTIPLSLLLALAGLAWATEGRAERGRVRVSANVVHRRHVEAGARLDAGRGLLRVDAPGPVFVERRDPHGATTLERDVDAATWRLPETAAGAVVVTVMADAL